MLRCLSTVRADLGRLLSSDRTWTPNALRSLYYKQADFDAPTLSTLIALFGSLSTPSRVYESPLLPRIRGVPADHRSYWAFVVRVGSRKVQSGMTLTDSDRFWLMRAALAASQALVEGPHNKGTVSPLILLVVLNVPYLASVEKLTILIARARHHYHAIRNRAFHPEVHVPYMKTLLGTRDPRCVAFVAQDVVHVLRAHSSYHPWLLEVLHSLILEYGAVLPNTTRDAIVSALWKCAQDARSLQDTPSHSGNDSSIDTPRSTELLDVTDIARHLSSCWSRRPYSSHPHNLWFVDELRTVLSPSQELSQRWMALTLVALFHSRADTTNDPLVLNDGALDKLQSPATACWRVIFGLAILEKLPKFFGPFSVGNPPLRRTTFRDTLRILYETWFHAMDTRTVPRDIACAITASFFRLAGIVHDSSLVDGCLALCDLGMLWGSGSSNTFMSAQYVVALLRLHGPNRDMVLRTLDAISSDTQWQRAVLATTLRELAVAESELAFALYGIAERSGRSVGPLHSHELAVSLAQYGALDRAVEFLRDEKMDFSQEQRWTLLAAIIRRIQDDAPRYAPVPILTALADVLLASNPSYRPPETMVHALGQLLLVLCRHGQGRKAVDVVVSTMRVSPEYFNLAAMCRLCRALLQHRQFKCAVRILDTVESLCPVTASRLRTAVAISATRAGATRTVKTLHGRLIPSAEIYLQHRTRTNFNCARSRSGHGTRRSHLSLRLAAFLRTLSPDDPTFNHLLAELLRSGRVLASKRILFHVLPSIPSLTRRTTLANVLLSGISQSGRRTTRNGRHVRKILALVEDLVAMHGIKPDRVTLNILVRTLLGWRSVFDRVRVRALFDQLVRGGYPAGDAYSAERPPFALESGVSVSMPIPMAVGMGIKGKLDFERHVRPLYRMFIEAFYMRDDVEAARRVIGILKVEERKDVLAGVRRGGKREDNDARAMIKGWCSGVV